MTEDLNNISSLHYTRTNYNINETRRVNLSGDNWIKQTPDNYSILMFYPPSPTSVVDCA